MSGNKINIWSDKGGTLNSSNAGELLSLAKQNNIAIEIDNIRRRPSVEMIEKAKEMGCRFTFAGLLPVTNMQQSVYVMDAIKAAKLNYKDLYIPKW